jgi:cytochrome c biogenesis protein ResB
MIAPFGIVWFVAMSIFFAVSGWFCIFRTDAMAAMGRRNYEKRKLVRARSSSNSSFVLKSSYPMYIRAGGILMRAWMIVVWLFVLVGYFQSH